MTTQRTALFRLVLTSVLCCLATVVSAAAKENWPGETTVGINLRQSPALSATVITPLPGGQALNVLQKQNEWLQVEVDGDGYGFRGWVYAAYVRPTTPLAEVASAPPPPVPAPPEAKETPRVAALPQTPPAVDIKPTSTPIDEDPAALATVRSAKEMARELAGKPLPEIVPTLTVAAPPAPVSDTISRQNVATLPPAPATPVGWLAYLQVALRLATILLAATALLIAMRAFQTARDTAMAVGTARGRAPAPDPHGSRGTIEHG